MFFKLVILIQATLAVAQNVSFIYNGFRSEYLSLDGVAQFTPNGILMLTNDSQEIKGHAFYPNPVTFKNSYSDTNAFSFSTTFVFAIRSVLATVSAHGMAFVIAPKRGIPQAQNSPFLGLFNRTNNGNVTNHIFAVELDTTKQIEFNDINNNHVGIDINGLNSVKSSTAGYYAENNGGFRNLSLTSGQAMQVWVEYDGTKKQINVIWLQSAGKPHAPLLSLKHDLSPILHKTMYVGFSSSTAQELAHSQLPNLHRIGGKKVSKLLTIGVPVMSVSLVLLAIVGIMYAIRRKRKFKYKELSVATKGFKQKELLGRGGFGKVYRGILPASKTEVAVKKVSHESRQGMKEFMAEVVSIGHLRHRNLVQLLGYCRRKGELLLVSDYVPNGSLDKYLYDQPVATLNWSQRFKVIRGVASGLLYLHENWEQVVVHRDVKASNVLLDGELNARLGDFGLTRLYDHGTDPQTTHIVGTLGYLAPEHTRSGRATTHTDVFAFGAFLLEVACGKRPIELKGPAQDVILVGWVFSCWKKNNRPSMRQVVRYLDCDILFGLVFAPHEGFDDSAKPYPSSSRTGFSSVESILLSGGR
ncbi:L-type lectin-domain containing receptor kinase IV.1-like [Pyrus ussuriensis x Pyrus communis]|uniref:non-specific serine/threonine protein kinase n=1 Tax=Pyrus ussuriensis x Pyrus communis TaxID=2448454 RepID=A0A5N5HV36_9ROSA|nr:L-type lectin-domain containing receptor kinase IV.1-like [Pyrus ussuriensis x Pyrus communis]